MQEAARYRSRWRALHKSLMSPEVSDAVSYFGGGWSGFDLAEGSSMWSGLRRPGMRFLDPQLVVVPYP